MIKCRVIVETITTGASGYTVIEHPVEFESEYLDDPPLVEVGIDGNFTSLEELEAERKLVNWIDEE